MGAGMRVLIRGAGVIGLSIGWQLARQGFEVEIFDKKAAGQEASAVAAGMLAPYSENLPLGKISLDLYPQFLKELSEDSKIHLTLQRTGTLYVGITSDDRRFLERLLSPEAAWLPATSARQKEPLLSPRVTSAIWIPNEAHIQNQKLLEALKIAFETCGGVLHEHFPVDKLEGPCVIDCRGAWSESVYPNKGQILTLAMPSGMSLNHMIRTPRVYLVAKNDGTLRVGATSEEVGFDQTVKAGAVLELLQAAYEVVPAIAQMPLQKAEANFRPASLDGLPCIDGKRATGHGRSGILLAPYTAYETVRKLCKLK